MSRTIAVALLAVTLAAPGARALAHADTLERDPAVARREAARDLAELVVASALDPRREGDGLLAAAEGSRLAWAIEPALGRRLFGQTLSRGEVLLASATTREPALRALPVVLARYSACDVDAAFAAADRIAAAAATGAHVPERAVVMARVAAAVAETNPAVAERFILEALRGAARSPHTWNAIRLLDDRAELRLVDLGLVALEGESPSLVDLLSIAAVVDLIRFERGPELRPNVTPVTLRRWLALASRRLEVVRAELVAARIAGRAHRLDPRELLLAESVGPGLLNAVERWFPEGRRSVRAAFAEIVASGPYEVQGGITSVNAVLANDRANFVAAFAHARAGREKEARAAVAAVEYSVFRTQAGDEVALVLAANDYAREDWTGVGQRLARVERIDLRARATGLVARLLAEQGEGEAAAEFAAEAVRLGPRAPRTAATVAGLLDGAIALEIAGVGARAGEALREALDVFDVEGQATADVEPVCQCGQFAPSAFGGVTVSGGDAVEIADLPLERALGAAAERDLLGTRLAVDGVEHVERRELAQLALLRALIE